MKLNGVDLQTLHQTARQAAAKASDRIRVASQQKVSVEYKSGADSLAARVVTEVDRQCQALILDHLADTIKEYNLAVLSEEQQDVGQRLEKDYFWCIDPLDGTLSFTESKPGYAVSIALVARDGNPVIGVVHDPVTDTSYSAIKKQGLFKNGKPWDVPKLPSFERNTRLCLPIDRSFVKHPDYAARLEQLERNTIKKGFVGLDVRHDGGAVMNAIQVLLSPPGLYFKLPKEQPGGGSLWDFAASTCLFQEAGAVASDFYGKPLDLNQSDTTFMNQEGVLFASNTSLLALVGGLVN